MNGNISGESLTVVGSNTANSVRVVGDPPSDKKYDLTMSTGHISADESLVLINQAWNQDDACHASTES